MSESNLPSPLLDGFAMGNPISEHNGIRCCPAIKENTDKKYIVKIIAIPASQVQMDALLLAGAYKDPSDAMDYFRQQGEEVLKEAALLKELSQLEGFLSYDNWQMQPITRHRLGYEIYLTGSYKRSLERYMRHNAVTHLEAINLGLDMCSALSVCRQAGALYVDLKPSNIFMSDKKEYRIGDLGFLSMDTLRYAALPEKYLSSYTPPELYDPMASVNMSADTYALGMILYQLYNDGSLPFRGRAPEEGLPSPVHADYELAEIIMKAIHPDPEQRYQEPAEMGKALAEYMQRNSINDIPITPLRTKKIKTRKKQEPVLPDVPDAAFEPVEEPVPEASQIPSASSEEPEADQPASPDTPEEAAGDAQPEAEASASTEEASAAAAEEEPVTSLPEDAHEPEEPEEPEKSEEPEEPEESDIPDPEEPAEEQSEPEADLPLSEELSRILAQADELIAHQIPEDIQLPEEPEQPDPFAFAQDEEELDDSDIPYDPLMEEDPQPQAKQKKPKAERKFADPKYKRRRKRFLSVLLLLVLLALTAMAGSWYYQNYYLKAIDSLTITGDRNQITVYVDTQAEESDLRVICQDSYGNSKIAEVSGGQAVFTGLQTNTLYTIQLEIEGFHGLTGKTSDVFTTSATTTIVSFTSIAGAEDGSVMLNFTVDGDEPEHWAVIYSAEGEETIRETFTGHSVTISGLSLGKHYTFTLDAGDRLSLGGNTTLELLASRLILAENLSVTSANGNDMTIRWNSPGDVVVDSWDVRCYNDMGYDQTLTVAETEVTFSGIDPAWEYTIEVTASGMTKPARTGITANPINIQSLSTDESKDNTLQVSWTHEGDAPEGGWLLLYTIDGSESHVVKCDQASAEITPKIPGARYVFTLQSADGTSIFNNVHTHTTQDAQPFAAHQLSAEKLTVELLKTPEEEAWYAENVSSDQLTSQFQSGDRISIALRSSDSFYLPGYKTAVLYVIRDSYGNVLSPHTQQVELVWKNIWNGGDSKNGELDIPSVPANAGNYVLDLYFDGMFVAELPFTIS